MLTNATANQDTVLYHVQPGDSLSKIIRQYYGPINPQQQNAIISQIKSDNPQITDPNKIYPGQVFLLDIPEQSSSANVFRQAPPLMCTGKEEIRPFMQAWHKATPGERDWMSVSAPWILGAGSSSLSMINNTFKSNTPTLVEMVENYTSYKENKMTRGQYDFKRQKLLGKLKAKLGPTQTLLSGNKSANEVLRISRAKGKIPTVKIDQQISKMASMSKHASKGGVVLSVVGLGIACHSIANTDNKQEKNEIFVESISGFGGGIIYGAVASVFLIGTPIGWVAALAIGIGGAVTGFGAGKFVRHLYTTSGSKVDLVSASGVKHICK